jgi:hypothetical protein
VALGYIIISCRGSTGSHIGSRAAGGRHRQHGCDPRLAPSAVALSARAGLHAGPALRPGRVQVRIQAGAPGVPPQEGLVRGRHCHQPPVRGQEGRRRRLLRVRGRDLRLPPRPRLGPRHDLQRRHGVLQRSRQQGHGRRARRSAGHRPPQPARAVGALRLAEV